MKQVAPDVITNAIMGKLYAVLTGGDESVPKSEDNFFSWCTPGQAVTQASYDFLVQGFSGKLKPEAIERYRRANAGNIPDPEGDSGGPGLSDDDKEAIRDEDETLQWASADSLSRLVDFIPEVGSTRKTLDVNVEEGVLSEVWERILTMSQVRKMELTKEEIEKINNFREFTQATVTTDKDPDTGTDIKIIGEKPVGKAYRDYHTAYDKAVGDYGDAWANAQVDRGAKRKFAVQARSLRGNMHSAMSDWETYGYKLEVDKGSAFIEEVSNRDLSLLKKHYGEDMTDAKLANPAIQDEFNLTLLTPADFATSTGWTQFTFNSGDIDQYAKSDAESHSTSVSAGGGWMGIGASAGHSDSSDREAFNGTFNAKSFSLTFEIAQAAIVRPWFHPSFIKSKSWRFSPGSDEVVSGDMVSDGGNPPKGLMPAYPTSVIFIRNLSMQIGENSGYSNFLHKAESSATGGGDRFHSACSRVVAVPVPLMPTAVQRLHQGIHGMAKR